MLATCRATLLIAILAIAAGIVYAQTAAPPQKKESPGGANTGEGKKPDVAEQGTEQTAEEKAEEQAEEKAENVEERRKNEAAMNEDPEAQRRALLEAEAVVEPEPEKKKARPLELYASVRIHAINSFDLETGETTSSLGDGASRMGLRADWEFVPKWHLLARLEAGFDILEQFTARTGNDEQENGFALTKRLAFAGVDSAFAQLLFGKNWSTYYQVAGMADRFAIFGGNATGVYNAGTDGGATGTGRADDVLQARFYVEAIPEFKLKPFNLNLQYQDDQPIPGVEDRNYGKAFGVSAWLETESEYGIGLAYNQSRIEDQQDPVIQAAGITGNATAFAISLRSFGKSWYVSLVGARLRNIETTDQGLYIDAIGVELYAQWEVVKRWWIIGGGNWLDPNNDDPDAGEYHIGYAVLGLRYTFDSFDRMVYGEWRINDGATFDGTSVPNEITFGVRWDFGY